MFKLYNLVRWWEAFFKKRVTNAERNPAQAST